MKINKEKKLLINQKLDIIFDTKINIHEIFQIFNEIFDLLDEKFENEYPEHYFEEVKRIRDLHNSFQTAYQEGRKKVLKLKLLKNF